MGRKCCVPGCKSNYSTEACYTTVFNFPKEEARRALWSRSINRVDFNPSSTAVICVNHFSENFIVREDRVTRDDGSVLVVPRKNLALTSDAYPTIFPNQPSYMTKELPLKRKSPSERFQKMVARDEDNFAQWCADDSITSFGQFESKYCSRLNSGWLAHQCEDFILFYRIQEFGCPKIIVLLKIFKDLTIAIWHGDAPVDTKSLEWVLGPEKKCDKWTKFDCLLNLLASYEINGLSIDQKLAAASHFLRECCSGAKVGDEDHSDFKLKLDFILDQIGLMLCKQLRYSSDLLLWASKLYFCYPASYNLIRSSGVLTLPHPCYLKKLAASLSCTNALSDNHHIIYLKKKAELLNDHEKFVNVLLDEIYVTPFMSFKGGHLVGFSSNTNTEATTIQTFMISSLLSKNKDVVALIPVRNITAETLYSYTHRVLHILCDCGYSVLSLISDNNRVNRNMFTIMCGGQLRPSIKNPVGDTQLFFLFDSVHLIKAVRNNWLNQTNTDQSLYYPDPDDFTKVCCASLLHLKKIYEMERNAVVKQAPRLSQKVLFPTSTERQNVAHALNLFHETNVTALQVNYQNLGDELRGTKKFIEYILKWWNIVNVKHPQKGMHHRNMLCAPIKDVSDDNVSFLPHFSAWLSAWANLSQLSAQEKCNLGIPGRGGMLSRETQFSLKFTTDSLVEIIYHVFQCFGPSYILLGKFQTDSLEARFGQYRQMNGGNYNISCRQIYESERKLRLLSLINLYSEKLGKFEVRSLECTDADNCLSGCDIPQTLYEVFNTHDDREVTESTFSVLIYIAGYVAYKVYQNVRCKECFLILACDEKLKYEISHEEVTQYLQFKDRGGLKWPQEFTVQIVVHTFQIFQKLISKKYEEIFLRHHKQKHLVVQLTLEKLDLLNMILNEKCICGTEHKVLAKKCLSVVSNILLNNYTKVKNDRQKVTKNKRKLSTLISC